MNNDKQLIRRARTAALAVSLRFFAACDRLADTPSAALVRSQLSAQLRLISTLAGLEKDSSDD